jgi:uncharacterized repeat protein (TIGR01451 family)
MDAFANNVIINNSAGSAGSGFYFNGDNTYMYWTLKHTTIGNNGGGDGTGIYALNVRNFEAPVSATLFYSQAVGVKVNGSDDFALSNSFWDGSVVSETVGVGGETVEQTDPVRGDAALAPDGYHLTLTSDAIDAALASDVSTDIDNDRRPIGYYADIGADEYVYQIDFALSKFRVGDGNVDAGDPVTYTLTVTNSGTSDTSADAVVVDIFTPTAALAGLSGTAQNGSCTTAGATITCTLYAVPTDTARSATVVAQTASDYDGPLTNSATVTPASALDPTPENNAAGPVTVTVAYAPPEPDLWVTKDVSAAYIDPPGDLVYTVTWGNQGELTAMGATLTDTLPAHTFYLTADPLPDAVVGRTLTWDLGSATPGVEDSIVITARVADTPSDGTQLINSATVTTTTPGDPPLNNTAVATTTVVDFGDVVLTVTKSADVDEVEVGDELTYTIRVENTGGLAVSPYLEDAIPAGTEYVPASAWTDAGTVGLANDVIQWVGELSPGESARVGFKVQVNSCVGVECGKVRNTTQVRVDEVAYVWEASVDTRVKCPDLTVKATAPRWIVRWDQGEMMPFDVFFDWENVDWDPQCAGTARNVKLTVNLPVGNIVPNPQPDEVNGQEWSWNLGDVVKGGQGRLHLQVLMLLGAPDQIPFEAAIHADPDEECPGNAPNTAEARVFAVDMNFTKVDAGQRLIFQPGPRVRQDYLVRYHYETSDPIFPMVEEMVFTDTWPTNLSFDDYTSYPRLESSSRSPNKLVWQSRGPLYVGQRGWLSLSGSQSYTQAVPDQVIENRVQTEFKVADRYGAITGTGTLTAVASVTGTFGVYPPYISFPQSGQICPSSFPVRGAAQAGAEVHIYSSEGGGEALRGSGDASSTGLFNINVAGLTQPGVNELVGHTFAGGKLSDPSRRIFLEAPENLAWDPQRSYWRSRYWSGPLEGEETYFRFKNNQGYYSTENWVVPGFYGFVDSFLSLYSCGCQNGATPVITVTADGQDYQPYSVEGPWHHFAIHGAHNVNIITRCGDEEEEDPGTVLIDPDGYIFDVDAGGEYDATTGMFNPVQAISGVTVTCMVSEPTLGGWVPWPAHLYEDQVNPQVTDGTYPDGITTTGYYAFFTPPGHYYIQVEGIEGYQAWRSPVVEVITQIVHVNVPYTPWISDTDIVSSVVVMPASAKVGGGTLWAGVQLDPAVITVPVGSAVEWTSALSETNTVDDLIRWSENPIFQVLSERDPLQDTRGFDSGYLEPGRVYWRAFASPGVYTYTVYGRSGRVIVIDERFKIYLPLVLRE